MARSAHSFHSGSALPEGRLEVGDAQTSLARLGVHQRRRVGVDLLPQVGAVLRVGELANLEQRHADDDVQRDVVRRAAALAALLVRAPGQVRITGARARAQELAPGRVVRLVPRRAHQVRRLERAPQLARAPRRHRQRDVRPASQRQRHGGTRTHRFRFRLRHAAIFVPREVCPPRGRARAPGSRQRRGRPRTRRRARARRARRLGVGVARRRRGERRSLTGRTPRRVMSSKMRSTPSVSPSRAARPRARQPPPWAAYRRAPSQP